MKNLITTMASMLILMIFLLQFINNQVLHYNIMNMDRTVNCYKEIVKQEGYLSNLRTEELKSYISKYAGCDKSEILISKKEDIKTRGNVINFTVKVPIKNLIAANELLGIGDEENTGIYSYDIYTTSEYINR